MTERKYEAAAKIAKKALAMTTSIKTLTDTKPDDLIITMERKHKGDSNTVRIYCMDSGNPADLLVQIHTLILDNFIEERDLLKAEFKAL